MIRNLLLSVAALASLTLLASGVAQAQQYPGYAPYRNVAAFTPEIGRYRVRGWVDRFDRFNLTVRAQDRFVPVDLHQGTVILPTGLTLQPGMFVTVDGYWNGNGFHADRIVLIR